MAWSETGETRGVQPSPSRQGRHYIRAYSEHERLLKGFRYVITSTTTRSFPRGALARLVGTIAHPLNQPVLDPRTRMVTEGYAIIQPRMGISLVSAHSSRFAEIFSGHAGLDPYTQTVSEVYQDLFREGSYIGKGIYDLHAFAHALENRVPENALLSHDLFEGLFARVALATDIELFDDFPSKYHVAFAQTPSLGARRLAASPLARLACA